MSLIEKYLEQNPTFTPAVVGYLVEGDKVLLGLRKKVSFGLGENLIAGIGGKVGDILKFKDESKKEALIREFEEEIRVEILEYKRLGRIRYIFPHKPKWDQDVTIYIVTKWEGVPQETESISPSWYKQDDLPKGQMWEDNLYTIPNVLAGNEIEGTFLYGIKGNIEEYHLKLL